MKIVTLCELLPRLDKAAVLQAVRAALMGHSAGEFQSPMPGELVFPKSNGDCHIKYGHRHGTDTFAIKVSAGFYDNEKRGIPINNGLTLVFDAQTGTPRTLFQDEGWLTAWRTVAATVLAVQIAKPKPDVKIGIIGTGLQGKLAGEWLTTFLPNAKITLCGRDAERTKTIANQLGCHAMTNIDELLSQCEIIVTTTPSAKPLFDASLVRPGMHFIGLGADSAGKHELPSELFAMADHIIVDDLDQSLALGDYGRAVGSQATLNAHLHSFGDVLVAGGLARQRNHITVVDLTGLAAQDIAIADLFTGSCEGSLCVDLDKQMRLTECKPAQ
jgi:ornithine cyclodeaminase